MPWLRAHPFAVLFALAGLVVLAIALAVQDTRVPAQGPLVAVSGGAIQIPTSYGGATSQPMPPQQIDTVTQLQPTAVAPAQPTKSTQPSTQTVPLPVYPTNSTNITVQPSQTPTKPDTSAADALLNEVYALIPSGVPVFGAPTQTTRSPAQKALYDYGNQAGLAILTFENAHPDMGQMLQNWLDHRSDASYKDRVVHIADDMAAAGNSLTSLTAVPPSAAAANARFAASLGSAATQLKNVVNAGGTDSTFVGALKTYDASADEFTKSYVALVDLFALNEVTFAQSDTGSVFEFSAASF